MKFSVLLVLLLGSHLTSANAINVDLENLAEKKKTLDSAYQNYQNKKQEIIDKIKDKKLKIKNKLKKLTLGQNLSQSESEELYSCLYTLADSAAQGSLDALVTACDIFDVDSTQDLEFAFNAYFELLPSLQDSEMIISLCKKCIGDDGLEYDDGLEDEILEAVSFYCLPIHQWEKKVIEKLITNMAEKNLGQLLLDRKEMEKRGDQIHHVHPLRFMGHVLNDSYLKACMNQVRTNSFKWSNFIDGFTQKMREELAKDNLLKHVDGFCEFIKCDTEAVYDFINKGNLEGLVVHLLQL